MNPTLLRRLAGALVIAGCCLGCRLTLAASSARADGGADAGKPHAVGKHGFELQIVVDFYDHLARCHYDQKRLEEMMRIFHEWGIKRVYWNGLAYSSGMYDSGICPTVDTNALRTFQELGEFIPAAVKCAHQHGMAFYVEFKPFDLCGPFLVPHDMNCYKVHNTWRKGFPAIGGFWQDATVFAEQHPEYLMARNMTGIRAGIEREVIATIQFIKQDAKPTGITKDNLQIYVSQDNHHYRPYNKPYEFSDRVEERPVMLKGINFNRPSQQKEQVRVLTLSGLAISEPYVAISTQKKTGTPDFANLYYKLVEIYTAQGEPIPFTYGLPNPADGWYPPGMAAVPFPDRVFMFDRSGIDAGNHIALRANDEMGYLDSSGRLLGLAKGKNRYITALCPAYPEVRKYWLDQVQQFIDWGVDGVEFRWAAHQDTREWDAYGFNAPVVEEYKRRYGQDILREDFDRAKWRKLRGEFYTLFYRQAKELLARHGKKMMVEVKRTVTTPIPPNHNFSTSTSIGPRGSASPMRSPSSRCRKARPRVLGFGAWPIATGCPPISKTGSPAAVQYKGWGRTEGRRPRAFVAGRRPPGTHALRGGRAHGRKAGRHLRDLIPGWRGNRADRQGDERNGLTALMVWSGRLGGRCTVSAAFGLVV